MIWLPSKHILSFSNWGVLQAAVAKLIKSVLVRALISIHVTSWSTDHIVGGSHRCITSICSGKSYHSLDVFLDVLNKSLNNVDLLRAAFDKFLDSMVDLFFVLTSSSHL